MFALGLVKLFVAAIVVAVLWYGYRWVAAMSGKMRDGDAKPGSVEMKPCPVCGTYRPAQETKACEREDCPYR